MGRRGTRDLVSNGFTIKPTKHLNNTTLMRQHQQEEDKDENKQFKNKITTNYLFCADK